MQISESPSKAVSIHIIANDPESLFAIRPIRQLHSQPSEIETKFRARSHRYPRRESDRSTTDLTARYNLLEPGRAFLFDADLR